MADEEHRVNVADGLILGHDDDGEGPLALEEETGPCRRCIVSGEVLPIERLIRFVVGPDGSVVPDIEARLPGRGLWLSAGRDMVNTAAAKNLFAKAFRRKVVVPSDLCERIENLLLRRCIERIGLARRAGQAIAGFEKVRGELKAGHGAVLLAAADGSADGRDKIRALAPGLPLIVALRGDELGAAFGRDRAVHVLLTAGRLAEGLKVDAVRLAGFRPE
ncbi:RNA-binding protein [Telmatospirillum sp.]|uniref:RNA-binding protein n=1 Tax=Telmatospirillum sp. TaxID=2079197 RepID=UPI00283EC844|nr:RNA-binding protein [Telmatospirillum sp.]MDR3440431.1 RNA-binding protein [Telmatospirillum sp.]